MEWKFEFKEKRKSNFCKLNKFVFKNRMIDYQLPCLDLIIYTYQKKYNFYFKMLTFIICSQLYPLKINLWRKTLLT